MSEALLLQGIAGYAVEAGTNDQHHVFAALLLGRPFDEPDLAIRACTRWAQAESRRAVSTGRAPVERAELLAFRLIYRALRAEAAAVKPSAAGPAKGEAQWRRTLGAMSSIRHRQRAALTLRYMFGLTDSDAGWVIGIKDATPVLAPAIQRVVRVLGGPADVPRALRTAGKKLCPPVMAVQLPPVARLPRPVIRTLIAPPLADPQTTEPDTAAPEPEAKRSPVEVLIGAHPRPEPCIPGAPPRQTSKLWSLVGRVASAAAVVALFAWAVWPSAGR